MRNPVHSCHVDLRRLPNWASAVQSRLMSYEDALYSISTCAPVCSSTLWTRRDRIVGSSRHVSGCVGSPCRCLRYTCCSLSLCCRTWSCTVYPKPAERSNTSYSPNPPDRRTNPKARKSLGSPVGTARLIQPESQGPHRLALGSMPPRVAYCRLVDAELDWGYGPEGRRFEPSPGLSIASPKPLGSSSYATCA